MSRETPEWIGAYDDQAIPPRVKVRIFDRCAGKCCDCTLPIQGKLRPAYDHIQALINGGLHREFNLQVLCLQCHAIKTQADVAEKSVTARKRTKHLGIKKPRTIRSWRRFDGTIVHAERDR
jgi:5-methylcytosine-specific restriction protein A